MEKYITYLKSLKDLPENEENSLKAYNMYVELLRIHGTQFHKIYLKTLKKIENGLKEYRYLITFTLDPKKNKFSDSLYDKVEKYVVKQLKREPLKLENVYYVREGGDEDHKHTHWHASVKTTKFLKRDRFHHYEKIYGNIDISGTKMKTQEHAIKYMSKQRKPIFLG